MSARTVSGGAPPPTLAFEGTEGAIEFRVSFAVEPSFRKLFTLPRRGRWTPEGEFTLNENEWRRIRRRAARKESGEAWWWVTARDPEGQLRSCRARRLVLGD